MPMLALAMLLLAGLLLWLVVDAPTLPAVAPAVAPASAADDAP